jgi:hypothetical protein
LLFVTFTLRLFFTYDWCALISFFFLICLNRNDNLNQQLTPMDMEGTNSMGGRAAPGSGPTPLSVLTSEVQQVRKISKISK